MFVSTDMIKCKFVPSQYIFDEVLDYMCKFDFNKYNSNYFENEIFELLFDCALDCYCDLFFN